MTEHIPPSNRPTSVDPAALSVRVLRQLGEVAAIADQWDDLTEAAERPPMTSASWIISHLEQPGAPQHSILCFAVFHDNLLVGVLPLSCRPTRILGADALVLTQPGDPPVNVADCLARPGYARPVLTALRSALESETPGWYSLELRWVDHRSPFLSSSPRPFPGVTAVHHAAGLSAYTTTVGDWDTYFETVHHSLKKQIRRARRLLADYSEATFEFFSGEDAVPGLIERFIAVEAAGWKGAARSALAANPAVANRYRAICTRLHRRGLLEWHFLNVDGRDIAAHFAVRSGRILYLYKIGYNEAYRRCSPGVLLREETMKRAFNDPATDAIDFVTHRKYHDDWRPKTRPLYHVWLFPRRPRSLLVGAWPRQIRQGLRRIPGVTTLARAIRGNVQEGSAIQSREDFLHSRNSATRNS